MVSICIEFDLDIYILITWIEEPYATQTYQCERTHFSYYSILFHAWSCCKLRSIQLDLFSSELCFQKFEFIDIKLNFIDFLYRFSLVMLYLVKQKKVAEHIKEFFAMKSLNKGFSASLCNVLLISHWSILWLIIKK